MIPRRPLRSAGPEFAAWALLLLGLGASIAGYVHLHGWSPDHVVADFYSNAGTTLLGTAIAVLVIDRLAEARTRRANAAQLVRDMTSSDNGLALRALAELRALGHLTDGLLDNQDFALANLRNGSMDGMRARHARFPGAQLIQADLTGADLAEASFNRADLTRCNLEGAVLAGASFIEAMLEDADCAGAKLGAAVLSGAVLSGADFRGADLRDARLDGANLMEAKMTGALVGGAVVDDATRLPDSAPSLEACAVGRSRWPDGEVWP